MPKLPVVTAQKLIKVLKKKGFILYRTESSHFIFIQPEKKIRITVPVHKGHDLGKGLTLSIIRDMKLTPDEFIKLLKGK